METDSFVSYSSRAVRNHSSKIALANSTSPWGSISSSVCILVHSSDGMGILKGNGVTRTLTAYTRLVTFRVFT